ncbi:major facilitator superfamily transporter [Metarhizium acridum CQMa 102]|uniref:Major facilitator superfamily transporter n=1 Tax=Metarhizium acridum (strain CQMa 102) TaxID=655827 RepID=E9DUY8_METAQ|nr:major facilitator superfamily transporter [Metarhizium acridum CQMa 102]EFY92555.1 major facilitator superfamily transporter [Metarhizium acridum CQMa 102]
MDAAPKEKPSPTQDELPHELNTLQQPDDAHRKSDSVQGHGAANDGNSVGGKPSQDGIIQEEAGEEAAQDESNYPGLGALTIIMVAVSMGMFLVSLDRTIISTAAPTITDQFHSPTDIGWYGSAYSLTGCAMQLPLGRFYKFYSPKWVYMTLVFIFIVGSAVGAGAMNSNTVIIGRAIQGIGLGGVLSGSTIIVTENCPLRRQPICLGILMATMSISAIVGPLIGGALTTNTSWRWCFIINIPIGFTIIAILFFFVKSREGKDQQARGWAEKIRLLDPLGSALLLPAVVCLVLAFQWAGSEYSWNNWRIIVLFVFGGLLSLAFMASQIAMPETATVPPHVAGQRTVFASFVFSAATGGAMLVVTYWIADWFQAVQNLSAAQAGIRTIALVLSQAVGAIMGGGSARLVGYPPPIMMVSAILISVGAGMLSTLAINESSAHWIGYQVMMGLGLGFGTQQASLAVQTVLKKEDVPSAISLIFFGMQLGGSIFICVGQNVFNQVFLKLLRQASIPGLDPETVLMTGATEIRNLVHNGEDLLKLLEAYNRSITSTFYVAVGTGAVAMLSAFLVQWNSVKNVEPVH